MNYVEVARTYVTIAENMMPQVNAAIDTLHRHHLQAIGRRYSDVGAPTSALNVVPLAVAFADLAGYTGLTHELDPVDFATMIARFETVTGDVITTAGATVVKRIGDAVMFIANAPGIACSLAVELVEACARERLPKLRVGLAFGDVMVRQGDFYGRTVNLAARLVSVAEPGTALADAALHTRLASVRAGYAFVPTGWYELAGFPEPVPAYQLLRT
jgi:class 3 adenylate cyclase